MRRELPRRAYSYKVTLKGRGGRTIHNIREKNKRNEHSGFWHDF
jgi:hypothetical protein